MKTILLMSLFIFAFAETGGANPNVPHYPADSFTARDGTPFTITFFKHASLAIEVDGKSIYIDPVDGYAAYDLLPKADLQSWRIVNTEMDLSRDDKHFYILNKLVTEEEWNQKLLE